MPSRYSEPPIILPKWIGNTTQINISSFANDKNYISNVSINAGNIIYASNLSQIPVSVFVNDASYSNTTQLNDVYGNLVSQIASRTANAFYYANLSQTSISVFQGVGNLVDYANLANISLSSFKDYSNSVLYANLSNISVLTFEGASNLVSYSNLQTALANVVYVSNLETALANVIYLSNLQTALANVVYQSNLQTALANVVYVSNLETALANVVYQSNLQTALANVVYQSNLQTALANVIYVSNLQTALANVVYQSNLQTALANVIHTGDDATFNSINTPTGNILQLDSDSIITNDLQAISTTTHDLVVSNNIMWLGGKKLEITEEGGMSALDIFGLVLDGAGIAWDLGQGAMELFDSAGKLSADLSQGAFDKLQEDLTASPSFSIDWENLARAPIDNVLDLNGAQIASRITKQLQLVENVVRDMGTFARPNAKFGSAPIHSVKTLIDVPKETLYMVDVNASANVKAQNLYFAGNLYQNGVEIKYISNGDAKANVGSLNATTITIGNVSLNSLYALANNQFISNNATSANVGTLYANLISSGNLYVANNVFIGSSNLYSYILSTVGNSAWLGNTSNLTTSANVYVSGNLFVSNVISCANLLINNVSITTLLANNQYISNNTSFAQVATIQASTIKLPNASSFSGKYSQLEGTPTIPTNTSQLTNNSGFLTSIPSSLSVSTVNASGAGTFGSMGVSGVVQSSAFTTPTGQGNFVGWNRSGTGTAVFANQLGGGTGGWEWLAYNSSNVLTGVVMSLSQTGVLTANSLNLPFSTGFTGKTSQLNNDAGFISSLSGAVLTSSAGSLASLTLPFTTAFTGKTSQLNNDAGFLTSTSSSSIAGINSTGSIGINMTTPAFTLDVAGIIHSTSPIATDATSNFTQLWNDGAVMCKTGEYLRFGSVDAIGGAANWSEKMRIHTNGYVGIGTITPTYLLDVNGTARISTSLNLPNSSAFTGKTSQLNNDAGFLTSVSSSSIVGINSTGSVGINTASPAYTLDVNGYSKTGASIPVYLMPGCSIGLNAVYNSGWQFGAGSVASYGSIIGMNPTNSLLSIQNSGNSGNAGVGMSFNTGINLNSAGQVGINTASPAYTLDVSGTIRGSGYVFPINTWMTSNEGKYRIFCANNGRSYYSSGDGSHEWRTDSSGATGGMFLDANGLLVGTAGVSNPSSRTTYTILSSPNDVVGSPSPSATILCRSVKISAGTAGGGSMWNFSGAPNVYGSDLILTGGSLNDGANNGSGPVNYFPGNVYIQSGVAYNGGGGGASGTIVFQTGLSNGTGNYGERMRIHSNGYVGIATNSPTYPLDVAGEARTTGKITTSELSLTGNNAVIYGANINAVNGIYYNSGGNQGHTFSMKIGGVVSYPFTIYGTQITAGAGVTLSVPGTSFFGNVKIGTVATSSYNIDLVGSQRSTGNVIIMGKLGVNTTTPAYPVDIAGEMRVSANLYATGNLVSNNIYSSNPKIGVGNFATTISPSGGLNMRGTDSSLTNGAHTTGRP